MVVCYGPKHTQLTEFSLVPIGTECSRSHVIQQTIHGLPRAALPGLSVHQAPRALPSGWQQPPVPAGEHAVPRSAFFGQHSVAAPGSRGWRWLWFTNSVLIAQVIFTFRVPLKLSQACE